MEQQYNTWLDGEIIEIDCDGSEPITPRPKIVPVLNEEEQALADAVKRYRIDHMRGVLEWRDILEIVRSLGYRKVEPPAAPPDTNGSPQDPAHPDAAGNETPS